MDAWCRVSIKLIPKTRTPHRVELWRPISLTSVLQKLYLSVLVQLLEAQADEVGPSQCGFRSGHQTAEVSETIRQGIQCCASWNKEMYVLKADVRRASDCMGHGEIHKSLVNTNAHPALIHAFLQELSGVVAELNFPRNKCPQHCLDQGGASGRV